jgi:thiol-disulfide isomerase/thioredoxin
MLGSGKSSGMVNEATNKLTNDRLNAVIEEMGSKEYQKQREKDTTDVIPTHRHLVDKGVRVSEDAHLQVFEKERRNNDEGSDEDDADFAAIRQARVQAIKQDQAKQAEWRQKMHGTYREIGQDDFFGTVVREKGGSERVAVHFYHHDFEKCKVMDRHLADIAGKLMSVRFVKVDVAKAPFLVDKLKVNVLPCLVLFRDDVAVDRVLGFEDFGDEDVDAELLLHRVEAGLGLKA